MVTIVVSIVAAAMMANIVQRIKPNFIINEHRVRRPEVNRQVRLIHYLLSQHFHLHLLRKLSFCVLYLLSLGTASGYRRDFISLEMQRNK